MSKEQVVKETARATHTHRSDFAAARSTNCKSIIKTLNGATSSGTLTSTLSEQGTTKIAMMNATRWENSFYVQNFKTGIFD
jgi:hypothetical protein